MAIEELFNGQLSFADIDAEKFLHVRRAHADRRVNAMDRLTDDVINELIQLCLPHYHIKAGETVQQGRPYTRLETMVRVHLLQGSSSKTPVTKPDGTKMFRSVFLNDARRCCFFINTIVKYYYDDVHNLGVLWKSCSMAN